MHRIGRTARAGAEGIAISFCDNEEMAFLRDIEKLIQIKLPVTERRTGSRAELPAPHHRPQNAGRNGRNGNRRNGHQQRRGGNGGGNGHGQQRRNEQGHQGKQAQQQQHRRNGENRNGPAAAPSAPDNIGTVAFMKRPHRPQAGGAR